MIGLGRGLDEPVCSRAGCSEPAEWSIVWRNPRIHTGGRTKTWLACTEHVGYLRDFLATRDFPLEVLAGVSDRAKGDLA
ncbi:hypothetical protein [Microbacterium sp. NPDC055683]